MLSAAVLTPCPSLASGWKRHVIDGGSVGADGVRLADVNGDGRLDVTTGWEEGGIVRVYLHPGNPAVTGVWPGVTVGRVKSPEDAVLVDIDGDGATDVVSSCEGTNRTIFVHWAPKNPGVMLNPAAWRTEAIPATAGQEMWMFADPAQIDGRNGTDLFVGSKEAGAAISWLEAPAHPEDLSAWKLHRLREAGWIMSLIAVDIDGDGDPDVLFSDRKGPRPGVGWLENPGPTGVASGASWKERSIGTARGEVMFIDFADWDGDGRRDVVAAVKPRSVLVWRAPDDHRLEWREQRLDLSGNIGRAKAVRVGDIDLDGRLDLVFSCEGAAGETVGVAWFGLKGTDGSSAPVFHDISGPPGTKFDLVQLLDLDGDGDLDVLTCEESENLGVVWYENPILGNGPPEAPHP